MNRAERRAAGNKEKVSSFNLNKDTIDSLKKDSYQRGCDDAFICLLALPVMIIHDKFRELMSKEGREERFVDLLLHHYEMYKQGYFSMDDLKQCLFEEAGIKFDDITKDRNFT